MSHAGALLHGLRQACGIRLRLPPRRGFWLFEQLRANPTDQVDGVAPTVDELLLLKLLSLGEHGERVVMKDVAWPSVVSGQSL